MGIYKINQTKTKLRIGNTFEFSEIKKMIELILLLESVQKLYIYPEIVFKNFDLRSKTGAIKYPKLYLEKKNSASSLLYRSTEQIVTILTNSFNCQFLKVKGGKYQCERNLSLKQLTKKIRVEVLRITHYTEFIVLTKILIRNKT